MSNINLSRPVQALNAFDRKFRGIWKLVDRCRSANIESDNSWPSWCFLPFRKSVNVIQVHHRKHPHKAAPTIQDVWRLSAFAGWRLSKCTYDLDRELLELMRKVPLDVDMPCSVLLQTPNLGVYVGTTNWKFGNKPLYGFWAHMDSESKNGVPQLRLLLDRDHADEQDVVVVAIDLGPWTLAEGLRRAFYFDEKTSPINSRVFLEVFDRSKAEVHSLLVMLIYANCKLAGKF
jgi:hypothetical protein